MGASAKHHVCFVAYQAYPLFNQGARGRTGGLERRAALLARGLARRSDFQVGLLTAQHQQGWGEERDGVRIYPYPTRTEELHHRIRGNGRQQLALRLAWEAPLYVTHRIATRLGWDFLHDDPAAIRDHETHPRPRRFYADLPAEVFCTFGVNWLSAEVAAACRRFQKPCVLFLASDEDLDLRFTQGSHTRSSYGVSGRLGNAALEWADLLVAQTERQRQLVQERLDRDAVVLRNPIDVGSLNPPGRTESKRKYVLWVGRAEKHHKRADLFMHVAAMTPEIDYVCVLNRATAIMEDGDLFDELSRVAPPNVKILEYVSPDRMDELFCGALALASTSACEGFPNVFLQAGVAGAAVVSLSVDPDEMLAKEGCGLVAGGSVDTFVTQLRSLWNNRAAAASLAARLRQYVLAHHDLPGRITEVTALLHSIFEQKKDRWKAGKSLSFTGSST